jgi:hypothetical protein
MLGASRNVLKRLGLLELIRTAQDLNEMKIWRAAVKQYS